MYNYFFEIYIYTFEIYINISKSIFQYLLKYFIYTSISYCLYNVDCSLFKHKSKDVPEFPVQEI